MFLPMRNQMTRTILGMAFSPPSIAERHVTQFRSTTTLALTLTGLLPGFTMIREVASGATFLQKITSGTTAAE